MLGQARDQLRVQRRPRAHERGREQAENFVHPAVYHRARGPLSMQERPRPQMSQNCNPRDPARGTVLDGGP